MAIVIAEPRQVAAVDLIDGDPLLTQGCDLAWRVGDILTSPLGKAMPNPEVIDLLEEDFEILTLIITGDREGGLNLSE